MSKEQYVTPKMDVVELQDDVILTSQTGFSCMDNSQESGVTPSNFISGGGIISSGGSAITPIEIIPISGGTIISGGTFISGGTICNGDTGSGCSGHSSDSIAPIP